MIRITNAIKKYTLILFKINKNNIKEIDKNSKIKFIPITYENLEKVRLINTDEDNVKKFKNFLKDKDFGYYALFDNEFVAYGWAKHKNSKDDYFKVGTKSCYLCKFFTSVYARGNNIYPLLVQELIKHEEQYDDFYISVENINTSSLRGVEKVGFLYVREIGFWRAFRRTWNKFQLE